MIDNSSDRFAIGSTIATSTTAGILLPIVSKNIAACKSYGNDPKDSDNEIGGDDGCASCYSSSMRDLLSDELSEDCTFNGTDELHVIFRSYLLIFL